MCLCGYEEQRVGQFPRRDIHLNALFNQELTLTEIIIGWLHFPYGDIRRALRYQQDIDVTCKTRNIIIALLASPSGTV